MEKITTEQIATSDYFDVESHFDTYIGGRISTVEFVTEHIRAAARHELGKRRSVSKTGTDLLAAYREMSRSEFAEFAKSLTS